MSYSRFLHSSFTAPLCAAIADKWKSLLKVNAQPQQPTQCESTTQETVEEGMATRPQWTPSPVLTKYHSSNEPRKPIDLTTRQRRISSGGTIRSTPNTSRDSRFDSSNPELNKTHRSILIEDDDDENNDELDLDIDSTGSSSVFYPTKPGKTMSEHPKSRKRPLDDFSLTGISETETDILSRADVDFELKRRRKERHRRRPPGKYSTSVLPKMDKKHWSLLQSRSRPPIRAASVLRLTKSGGGAPVFPFRKLEARNIIEYGDFIVCYDNQTRTVCWSLELVKSQQVETMRWLPPRDRVETRVARDFRSGECDYQLNSDRFKKQHAAEIEYHVNLLKENVSEACVFTNIFPQAIEGKSHDVKTMWDLLYDHIVYLSKYTTDMLILTGALYLPQKREDGIWAVKYQQIGANKVAVPTHFYKVIVCSNWDKKFRFECYKFENKLYEGDIDVTKFLVSRHDLEKETGFLIFPGLPDSLISEHRKIPECLEKFF
uniref:Uncharacterized protein n=1 Tax=Strigamia maritima TaxID=126957 RepID=T1JED0_STRMM